MDTTTGPARRRIALMSVGAVAIVAAGVLVGLLTTRPAPTGSGAGAPPATTGSPAAGSAGAAAAAGQPPVLDPPGNLPTTALPTTDGPPPAEAVVYRDVKLPLPSGWRVSTITGPRGPMGCVLAPGQPAPKGPASCTITVTEVTGNPVDSFFVNPDVPGGFADGWWFDCPDDNRGVWSAAKGPKRTVTVDGRSGEYRSLTMPCASIGELAFQQWVFVDHPNVVLTGLATVKSGLAATIGDIVGKASLPAGDGARTADFGAITAVTGTGAETSIVFDRETPYSPWNDPGMVMDTNDNPTTYPLRLAPGAPIRSIIDLCDLNKGITGGDNSLGNAPCTLAQLTAAVKSRPRGPVWIKYDAQGRVASIYEVYRP